MSDSNRVQVSIAEESTWGTTPNSAFLELPIVSGSLSEGQNVIRSAQLRSDAQLAGSKRVGVAPEASLEFELQGDNHDLLLRAMLRNASGNDWSTAANIAGTGISAANGDNSFNGSSGMNTNVTIGQWVYVAGFLTAANNGWFKVVSATSTKMVVEGGTLSTEAAGNSITIKGSFIRNGTDVPSFSLQEEYLDLSSKLMLMKGAVISSAGLKISAGAIMTASLQMEGRRVSQETTKAGTGSVTAAQANDVIADTAGFDGLWLDDAKITTYYLTDISMALSARPRFQRGLGQLQTTGVKQGPLEVTGSFECYLDDTTSALRGKLLGNTAISLGFAITDGTHLYHFDLPKVYLTAEPGALPGNDSDIMLAFDFNAEPALLVAGGATKTIQICRVV